MVYTVKGMWTAFLLSGLLLLGGCSSPATPEEQVAKRAQEWADALLAKDLNTAYTYTSPSYRQSATPGIYHARIAGAGSWTGAEVTEVVCEQPEVCEVTIKIEYTAGHMGAVTIGRPIDWRWLKSDGQWWLYVPPK